ncbi:hypothetical protein V1514DRAFT_333976 [Lipomyces japonicus]|uniref:uncharacterized protein n=1 Tax=Lipomyces japonicus TaxID=56871 RepID=UPI0034CFD86E
MYIRPRVPPPLKSPAALLMSVNTSSTAVRRVSAAPPPPQELITAVTNANSLDTDSSTINIAAANAVDDNLLSPTDVKLQHFSPFTVSSSSSSLPTSAAPTPSLSASSSSSSSSLSSTFTSYYTAAVSSVSRAKIVAASAAVVLAVVASTAVQHQARLHPVHLSLASAAVAALAIRIVFVRQLLGSTAVRQAASDRSRRARALALAGLAILFAITTAHASATQNMPSLHTNYFSVLPPLDVVLQIFGLKVTGIKISRRAIASFGINLAPQALTLLARDWVVGPEAIPAAVALTAWIYVVYVEQSSTEAAAWLASVYLALLYATAALVPVSLLTLVWSAITQPDGSGFSLTGIVTALPAVFVFGVSLAALLVAAGFLIKWSSSAHIVVLVSSASTILIISEHHDQLSIALKLLAAVVTAAAWFIYVQ